MQSRWRFSVTELSALRPARQAFTDYLTSLKSDETDVASGEIVFGELVANALVHGDPGRAEVLVERTGGRIKLSVKSGGPPFVFAPEPPGWEQTCGRGFQIVAALASDVSVKYEASASTITATLRLTGQ